MFRLLDGAFEDKVMEQMMVYESHLDSSNHLDLVMCNSCLLYQRIRKEWGIQEKHLDSADSDILIEKAVTLCKILIKTSTIRKLIWSLKYSRRRRGVQRNMVLHKM